MKTRFNSLNNIHLRAIGVVAISIVVSTMLIGSVLSYYLEKKTVEKLDSLQVKTSSVSISLLSRSISINNLEWNSAADSVSTTTPHQAFLKKISVRGIGVYKLLFKNQIDIREIILEEGYLRYNRKLKQQSSKKKNSKIKGIDVQQFNIKNVKATVLSDSLIESTATINLSLGTIQIANITSPGDSLSYEIKTIDGSLDQISFNKEKSLYSMKASSIKYNSEDQTLTIDSSQLIPKFGKYEFAQHLGRQETRVEASIPKVTIEGFDFNSLLLDSSFTSSKVTIQSAHIKAFRDKRLPFKNDRVPLPMESLAKIKIAIELDSIVVKNMHITEEEFADNGNAPGAITFENLDAVFVNFSNRYYANKPPYATLYASALLMGKGKIDATFQFPIDGTAVYSAKGMISNMPLQKLNPILENLAHISIESGKLNEMTFAFDYTDKESKGTLQINYEDLKITSLNTDKHSTKNEFKTLLINTIVKNDKDENTDRPKRTGEINFVRDQQKFIFNLWWKSVLSGIKSSVLGIKSGPKEKNQKKKN